MSAVSVQKISSTSLPQHQQALAFWDELTLQCRRHVKAINTVVQENQLSETDFVQWKPGSLGVSMLRDTYPTTEIRLNLAFEHWGPKVTGAVRGFQEEDLRFFPEEFEFPLVSDEEDRVVAVSGEGRSLSPHEMAKYVSQHFRRCYPGLSLPSPENPFE